MVELLRQPGGQQRVPPTGRTTSIWNYPCGRVAPGTLLSFPFPTMRVLFVNYFINIPRLHNREGGRHLHPSCQ